MAAAGLSGIADAALLHPHLPLSVAVAAGILVATGLAARGGVFPEHGRHFVVVGVILGLLAAGLAVLPLLVRR